ncbi:DUF4129 domain-containing protein [Streptomyces sp. BK239]|uniref:DUF4129 domain-containing protein n=1 Tax=Streptomyces sp. BK239 TaxID=2512155 RepID=UPI00102B9095|nr:DUF4129 domain-containing protein [Streptomyces sp. BK239]RZU24557.1 uncharacterized protein DUF4129 [Streptomyces sp. BK239]
MSWAGEVLTAVPAPPQPTPALGRPLHALLRAGDGPALSWASTGGEPPVTIPRDPAREEARRELSKQLYHQNDPNLFQRALDALWNWIGSLFGAAATATPGGALGLLVITAAVVAVVSALWWRLGTPRRRPAAAPTLFDDRPRSAAEHRAAAEAHAAQGHFSQAVQERMRAVVRSLEERALLDARPGRTADEAAAEAGRTLPAHTDRLRAAARDFDDVTYGGRTATREAYDRITGLDRDLAATKPHLTHTSTPRTAHPTHGGTAG